MQCGWLKDRCRLNWQIVPDRLTEVTSDTNPAKAAASTKAMLGMRRTVDADVDNAGARL